MKKTLMIILAIMILFLTPIATQADMVSFSLAGRSYKEITLRYPTTIHYTGSIYGRFPEQCSIKVAHRSFSGKQSLNDYITLQPGKYEFSTYNVNDSYVSLIISYYVEGEGTIYVVGQNLRTDEKIKKFDYPTIIKYTATYAAQNNGNCSIVVAGRKIPVWGGTGEFTVPPGTYTFRASHGGSAGGYVSLSVHYIEQIPEDNIIVSIGNPTTNGYINNPVNIHWTNSVIKNRKYKIYNAANEDITPGGGYVTQTSLQLEFPEGEHQIYVKGFHNDYDYLTDTSDFIRFKIDHSPPTEGSLIINEHSSITNSRTVNLNISAQDSGSGVNKIFLSEDDITYTLVSEVEPINLYGATIPYNITSLEDGIKTIYVMVSDAVGNSATFSNQITLDTEAPIGAISISNPDLIIKDNRKYISSNSITLNLSATDIYSAVTTMQFSDDGIAYQPKVPYNTYTTYTLPGGEGLKTVYVKFSDALGNETIGSTIFDSVILDTSPPSGGIVKIDNSNTNITYINEEDNKIFTRDHNLILTLEADDRNGIGVASMSFSNDGINYSEWEAYTITKTWTIDPAGNDGPRTIHMGVRDQFGHEAFTRTEVILDRTPATGSITVTAANGRTLNMENPANSLNIKLQVNSQDNLGPDGSNSGVKGIYLWNGANATRPTDAVYKSLNEIAAPVDWTLDEGPDGIRTINMQVIDNTINISETIQVTVTLDRTAPGAPRNITHSYSNGVMTFKWNSGEPSTDISEFWGVCILPDGDEEQFNVIPSETKDGQYQINTNLGPNQPVIIRIHSVDYATNESVLAEHLGCTPADPGKLQFTGTGYDTSGNKHYLTWKLTEPGIAENHKLEYGQVIGEEFVPTGEITPGSDGVFTHNSTGPNPEDKLQPHATYTYRLAAYNKSGDRTYSPVFTQEVQNLPPVKPDTGELAPSGYASAKVVFDFPEVKDYDNDAITYIVKWAEGTNPAPGAYQTINPDAIGKFILNLNPAKHGTTFAWRLEAKDSYGAVTTSDPISFRLDVENPELTLEKPKSLYTNSTEIQVSVKDGLSGIKSLVFKIGTQEPQAVQLVPGTNGTFIGKVPLTEGQYNLKVTVQDQAGNSISEDVNNLWVDHTLPALEAASIGIDLPTKNGVYLTSGKIPMAWKAKDDSSGIAGIRYWILNNGEQPGEGRYIALSSGLTEYAHNLEIDDNKTNGQTYYLSLAVLDKAGNSSAVYRLPQGFLLDTTPPEAELTLTGLYPNGSGLYLTDLKNLGANLTIEEEESGATASFNLIDSAAGTTVTDWDQWKNIKKAKLTPGGKYRVAAKAINGVGLETEVLSEEFTFDNTAPVISSLTGPEQALTGGETFIISAAAAEPETGIIKYRIAIGVKPGETEFSRLLPGNVNGWYEALTDSLQPQIRLETPEIADGVYYIALEAVNAAGLTTRYNGNPTLTVNNHQERIVVSDQGPYTMFADKLSGWWRYTGTKQVTGYLFRIIDQNNQIIRDWENINETTVTIDRLQLKNRNTYRFEVKASFSDGTASESGFSPGVTVDTTAPEITELKTPLYATSDNFGFQWAGSDDCSGVSQVLAAIGTDYNRTDVTKGWVQVTGNSVKLSRDSNGDPLVFDLNTTKRYYLTLRLVNGAGLTVEKAAPAIVVDNTPPPVPVVLDQGGFINTKPEQPMEAHWFWSQADPESGSVYQWTILKYSEKINSSTQWHDGDETKRISMAMDDFEREHGQTYYFAVKATNGAGLSSIGYSDGIMADATAPYLVKVKVLDAVNQNGDEEINYLTDKNKALRLWIDSYDPDSDIAHYLYAWNIPEEVDDTERKASTDEPVNITNPNLVEGAINIFLGETVNHADIVSPSGYSTGIMVDSEAPVIKNVRGGVSGNSLLFDWDAEASLSPIVRYEYAFVSESKVNSITEGDWKIAEDKSLDRRLTLVATEYPDGRYCLVVRGFNAAGSYSRNDAEHKEWGISNVITLDRTVPEITTAVFEKYADEMLRVSVSALDEGSGIAGYQYALGSAANPFQFSGGWVDLDNQNSTVEIGIPTGLIPHNTGVYVMVRVKDQVGLWSETKVSGKVVIDHTKPEKPVITYGRYATNKLLLTGIKYQAADPESGLVNYRVGLTTDTGGAWLVTQEEQVRLTPEGSLAELKLAIPAPGLTEAGTYYLALQVQNGTGDWSETGYSGPITVDTIKPALIFTKAGETLVINEPPLSLEYTLTEEALVKFTITGADGVAKEEIIPGITGVNYYVFTEAKPQTYTVTAVPTDKAGNVGDPTGQTVQAIRVNAPPVVGLPGEIKATIGRTLTFKADVTDPDGVEGDSFSYEWLPGDGGPFLTGGTPEYIYNSLGEYTLVLKVTDKDGGWAMVTATVKVGNTAGGELCVDETWSGSHRIYGDVIVPSGIKLTILPGTEIIIDGVPGETGYDHALIVRGTLNAGAGTKFTSVTGTAGGWKGILVEGEANLEEGAISYAERGVAALDGAKVSLNGCTFEHNLAGVHAYNSNPEISSCVFKHNVYGIKEDESGRPVVKSCRFSGNGMDYYHLELTEISMEQLNGMPGNEGNVKE
jgi:hypothetical protein